MAPPYSRQYKAKASPSDTKNSKLLHDDIYSQATTASTASDSGSEQDRSCSVEAPTNLKSLRQAKPFVPTSLKSLCNQAKPFVPTGGLDAAELSMEMPPCMPTPGKDCLASVIQHSLGFEVWNLNMVDAVMPYSGEWYTAVEIVIPDLSGSMCRLTGRGDAEAIKTAQESCQSNAIQLIGKALADIPGMVLQPTEHGAQICVEYCEANRSKLCREYSHCASCPRGPTCRWEHALLELFMINIVLAPTGQWGFEAAEAKYQSKDSPEHKKTGRWQPHRAPMSPPIEAAGETSRWVPSRPPMPPSESRNEAPAANVETIGPLPVDSRPKNPRLVSRKSWADLQDDSDDDTDCFSFGPTP